MHTACYNKSVAVWISLYLSSDNFLCYQNKVLQNLSRGQKITVDHNKHIFLCPDHQMGKLKAKYDHFQHIWFLFTAADCNGTALLMSQHQGWMMSSGSALVQVLS